MSLPPDKRFQSDRRAETRRRLLEAMTEVGARLGYADSSVERVIQGTGIARSTFYEHFKDRDECFIAALGSLRDRLMAEIEAAAGSNQGKAAVAAAIEAMVGFADAEPAGARLLFAESLAGGRRSLELREEMAASNEALIEAVWARTPSGEETLDLPTVALSAGLFRLLAMRPRHGEAGLERLAGDLVTWADSYTIAKGSPRWRVQREMGAVEPLGVESFPSLDAPPPLPGGRHRLSTAEVGRSQRLRILRAVARCSYERGYAEVRVADIASEARVSRKAFYSQFRDKADAATEANERTFQAGMTAAAAGFFAAAEWPERVWAGGTALLSFLAAYPADAYLSFVEPHAIGVAAVQHVYDRLAAFKLFLEEGYHYPLAQGLPKASSEAISATMYELAFRELRARRSAEGLLQVMPQLAYTILAPFMGPEEAGKFVERKMSPPHSPA